MKRVRAGSVSSSEVERPRHRVALARWADLILIAVVATFVWTGIAWTAAEPACTVFRAYQIIPELARAGLLGVVGGAVTWAAADKRWRGFLGLRHFFVYPPTWVAVALALVAWCVIVRQRMAQTQGLHVDPEGLTLLLGSFGIPYTLVLAAAWVVTRARGRSASRVQMATDDTVVRSADPGARRVDDFAQRLLVWAGSDAEINSEATDLFGHARIARQVVARIKPPAPKLPATSIVGPLGSGKSSICALLVEFLRDREDVLVVRVGLWPYHTPDAALTGILDALTQTIAQELPSLPVSGIPARYLRLVDVADRWAPSISRILGGTTEPADVVASVSEVLFAAKLRLVLIVEDLERYATDTRMYGELAAVREADRIGPIRALLHKLDESQTISVVIASLQETFSLDLVKSVRFIEYAPPIRRDHVSTALEAVRRQCMSGWPVPVIDPVARSARAAPKAHSPNEHMVTEYLATFGDRLDLPKALAILLDTPRVFKYAIRATLDTWEALPGELELESALVLSALRVSEPPVFTVIEDFADAFALGFGNWMFARTKPDERHPARDALWEQLDKIPSDTRRNAVEHCLRYLFPGFDSKERQRAEHYIERPQSFNVRRHTNYLRRFLDRSKADAEVADQDVLSAIHAWKSSPNGSLADLALNDSWRLAIESFLGQFTNDDIVRLLGEVIERCSGEPFARWADEHHAAPIVSVWRMIIDAHVDSKQVSTEIVGRIPLVVRRSVPVLADLMYFFAPRLESGVPETVFSDDYGQMRDKLIGELLSCAKERPERFVEALQGGSPWNIVWLCYGPDRASKRNFTEVPFPRWRKFASFLIRVALEHPVAGVPILSAFITEFSDYMDDSSKGVRHLRTARVDQERAQMLFPLDELRHALSTTASFSLSGDIAVATQAARAWAQSTDTTA